MPCNVNAACGCVGEGVGNTASVTDDVKSLVLAFEIFVNRNLHIIELNLNAVEKSVIVRGTGSDLIKGVYHFDDAVENSLGKNE